MCLRLQKCQSVPEGGGAVPFVQQSRTARQELPAAICCAILHFIEVSDAVIFYVQFVLYSVPGPSGMY